MIRILRKNVVRCFKTGRYVKYCWQSTLDIDGTRCIIWNRKKLGKQSWKLPYSPSLVLLDMTYELYTSQIVYYLIYTFTHTHTHKWRPVGSQVINHVITFYYVSSNFWFLSGLILLPETIKLISVHWPSTVYSVSMSLLRNILIIMKDIPNILPSTPSIIANRLLV